MTGPDLVAEDIAVDHELADVALSFRFVLDLTPTNIVSARAQFERDGLAPVFEYRPLEDDPSVIGARLDAVAIDSVRDNTVAHLLLAKERELRLQVEMLKCRGSEDFLALSIELYGAVSPALLTEATSVLDRTPEAPPGAGAWLDAEAFAARARTELDHYRSDDPDLEAHVEIREGTTGLMVSNGELLIAPTLRVSELRVEALLQHEIGTHLVTHLNGVDQPLHVLAAGLAGYEETQEGLAVLAEHLVGGLTVGRLRQLAARVVAVHEMVEGATFPDVHQRLVEVGVGATQAFTITMRVFRSGGLTKDAVYLRGLYDVIAHLRSGADLDVLWLGKLPLTDAPLVQELRDRGVLSPPRLLPRYLSAPTTSARLAHVRETSSLAGLIGRAA
jgi:uncharacterized protein (TIGR02421 family)